VKGLRPIAPARPLSDEVTDALRERIYRGDITAGDRLVEATLAGQLGVSRGPVRDALQKLRGEGLVVEQARRGFRVVELTAEDITNICELRAAVEGRCAQLLAAKKDSDAVDELKEVLREMTRAATEGDPRRHIELDLQFHESLCKLSGNRRLHATFLLHAPIIRTLFRLDSQIEPPSKMTVAQHRVILRAIESGSPKAAQAAVDEHMVISERLLREYLGTGSPRSTAAR
jgi:DNA-binding GntR family transcriptional regulator